MNQEYSESIKRIQELVSVISKTIAPQISDANRTLTFFAERMRDVLGSIKNINTTEYMKPLYERFTQLAEEVQKAKENPDSIINYYRYSKKLIDFHWTWPYGLGSAEMLDAIGKIESEEEFDAWLVEYFDDEIIDNLFFDTISNIPQDYREAVNQVKLAIETGGYILANNTLISILDGMLSRYVHKKKIIHRRDILEPIVDFYDQYPLEKVPFIFELGMLHENINFIFEDIDFNIIAIKSHKQVRRHTSMHGMRYSNERVDAVFLANALYWLVALDEKLKPFENTIKEKDGKFKIKQDSVFEIEEKVNNMFSVC